MQNIVTKPEYHNQGIKRIFKLNNTKKISFRNNYGKPNKILSSIGLIRGSSQFIHIPNYGKRKVRYQKNGRAYVIVNKKKLKLN